MVGQMQRAGVLADGIECGDALDKIEAVLNNVERMLDEAMRPAPRELDVKIEVLERQTRYTAGGA